MYKFFRFSIAILSIFLGILVKQSKFILYNFVYWLIYVKGIQISLVYSDVSSCFFGYLPDYTSECSFPYNQYCRVSNGY